MKQGSYRDIWQQTNHSFYSKQCCTLIWHNLLQIASVIRFFCTNTKLSPLERTASPHSLTYASSLILAPRPSSRRPSEGTGCGSSTSRPQFRYLLSKNQFNMCVRASK